MSTKNTNTIVNHGGTIRIGSISVGDNHHSPRSATKPENSPACGDRARLRRRIDEVLRGDIDLESFCIDHFEPIYRRMTPGMERGAKINLLLLYADPRLLEERLADWS